MKPHPTPEERAELFPTQKAAELSGVTVRQLQHWRDRGVLVPEIHQHRALYSPKQIEFARRLKQLTRAGILLERVTPFLRIKFVKVITITEPTMIGKTLVFPGTWVGGKQRAQS